MVSEQITVLQNIGKSFLKREATAALLVAVLGKDVDRAGELLLSIMVRTEM